MGCFLYKKELKSDIKKPQIHNSFSQKKILFSKQIGKVRKFATQKKH